MTKQPKKLINNHELIKRMPIKKTFGAIFEGSLGLSVRKNLVTNDKFNNSYTLLLDSITVIFFFIIYFVNYLPKSHSSSLYYRSPLLSSPSLSTAITKSCTKGND
jgi:hypothetical protein